MVTHRYIRVAFPLINLNHITMDPTSYEPEGPLVTGIAQPPDIFNANLRGSYVSLTPLSGSHAAQLYLNIGGAQNAHLYKYLSSGPFTTEEEFKKYVEELCSNTSLFPFAILSEDPVHKFEKQGENEWPGTAIGIISLLNIVVPHRSVEIGHVLYAPTLQRTTAATEVVYLLMKYAFEDLGFLRVEWKCNEKNRPSAKAALRLGFVTEGTFRAHMIVKGRRRDSCWFSIIEDEWDGVKKALENWLADENFEGGKQKRKLEDIRAPKA